jgi:hypothetical protein
MQLKEQGKVEAELIPLRRKHDQVVRTLEEGKPCSLSQTPVVKEACR